MNVYGELVRGQLENLAANPSQSAQSTGRIWWNTATGKAALDDGVNIRSFLRNDQNIVIGNNGSAANNLRFNRAANATLELLIGSDATAEGTSTPANWAKLNTKLGGSLVDTFTDFTEVATQANPAASTLRLYAKSDGSLYVRGNLGAEIRILLDIGTLLTQTTTPSNPSAGSNKLYFKSDDQLYSLTSAGVEAKIPSSILDSKVATDTGNGLGAVNTRIRRFTNNSVVGTDISYADSANNGATFTINTAGVYGISYTDGGTAAAAQLGISLNSNQLTTDIGSVVAASSGNGRLVMTNSPAANLYSNVSTVIRLAVNDIIRAHTDTSINSVGAAVQFRIARLS